MINYAKWLALPLSTRQALAASFGVAKTGPTHVFDNVVKDDGYKIADLYSAFTIEAMQDFTKSTEKDPEALWDLVILETEPKEVVVEEKPVEEVSIETPVVDTPKRGRKPKTI